jgi:hypothetical protein
LTSSVKRHRTDDAMMMQCFRRSPRSIAFATPFLFTPPSHLHSLATHIHRKRCENKAPSPHARPCTQTSAWMPESAACLRCLLTRTRPMCCDVVRAGLARAMRAVGAVPMQHSLVVHGNVTLPGHAHNPQACLQWSGGTLDGCVANGQPHLRPSTTTNNTKLHGHHHRRRARRFCHLPPPPCVLRICHALQRSNAKSPPAG